MLVSTSLASVFQSDLLAAPRRAAVPASRANPAGDSAVAAPGGLLNPIPLKLSSPGSEAPSAFAAQLAQAVEGYLNGPGNATAGGPLQIEIAPAIGQNLGGTGVGRQFVVTIHGGLMAQTPSLAASAGSTSMSAGAAASPSVSPAVSSSTLAGIAAAMQAITIAPVDGATPVAPSSPVSAPTPAPTNEVDAYWAAQPEAVRVLRNIPTESARWDKAKELAAQGYPIDAQIMIWHLDPLATMFFRKEAGFTWVPAMGQAGPETGPGINFPGLKPYDASSPMPGSIAVSTDWAKGLEHTSPWRAAFTDGGSSS